MSSQTGQPRAGIPPLLLEQLALGELSDTEAAELRARLGSDEDAQAQLGQMDAEHAAMLDALPAAAVALEVRRRARQQSPPQARVVLNWSWLLVPALAAGLALLAWPTATPPGDGIRMKGEAPRLVVHRKDGDAVTQLKSGQSARATDVLQLAYVAAGEPHGVVLSIDGRGAVTLHHPENESGATALEQSGAVALGFAYELDDAPQFERFFFVTAESPIDVKAVLTAAEQLAASPSLARGAALVLPVGHGQSSFIVDKIGEKLGDNGGARRGEDSR